MTIDNIDV